MNPILPPLLLGAGGRSSRMGRAKHRLEFQGRPWILWQLSRFREAGGQSAVVVLPALEIQLDDLRAGVEDLRVDWLVQPDSSAPMSASLRLAVGHLLESAAEAAWWLPVDVPAPGVACWLSQWEKLGKSRALAVLPAEGGHPVLLARDLLRRMAAVPADEELRLDHLLRNLAESGQLERGAVADPCCRLNLNTPEAWSAWVREQDRAKETD